MPSISDSSPGQERARPEPGLPYILIRPPLLTDAHAHLIHAASPHQLSRRRGFAGDGAELVLVARGEGGLRELAGQLAAQYGARAQVVPADLSQPAGPGEVMQALAQQHIEVEVLVNNAGSGAHGPVAGIGVARRLEMIEVNVAALTRLTALLLPPMLERRRGAKSAESGRLVVEWPVARRADRLVGTSSALLCL